MRHQRGLSLVELMVALTLGIVILLAAAVIFANTSRSRTEMEKSNRQNESGRYASQLLMNNLRMAGYLAEFDPTVLALPVAIPNPCATDIAALRGALPLHVQGVNNASAAPACLTDVRAGTDIIAVRRASSCISGSAGCSAYANGVPHFQASACAPATGGTELSAAITADADYATHHFALSDNSGDFTRHKSDCTALADVYRYRVDIFFVANNNVAGDGIPTLKRAELGAGGFSVVPLVDGVENLQVEYGIDTDNDGIPNLYKASPANTAEWRDAMAARVFLLTRNTEATPGHADNRSYVLGTTTVGPFGDAYKRHVYSTTIRFANPSWRRQ